MAEVITNVPYDVEELLEIIQILNEMEDFISEYYMVYDEEVYDAIKKLYDIAVLNQMKQTKMNLVITLDTVMTEEFFYVYTMPPMELEHFKKVGWKYVSINIEKMEEEGMEQFAKEIPDDAYRVIEYLFETYSQMPEMPDNLISAGILYHDQILQLKKIVCEPLKKVVTQCLENMTRITFHELFPAYETENGLYIPIILYDNEDDPRYSILEYHLCMGRLLDACLLSRMYNMYFGKEGGDANLE